VRYSRSGMNRPCARFMCDIFSSSVDEGFKQKIHTSGGKYSPFANLAATSSYQIMSARRAPGLKGTKSFGCWDGGMLWLLLPHRGFPYERLPLQEPSHLSRPARQRYPTYPNSPCLTQYSPQHSHYHPRPLPSTHQVDSIASATLQSDVVSKTGDYYRHFASRMFSYMQHKFVDNSLAMRLNGLDLVAL